MEMTLEPGIRIRRSIRNTRIPNRQSEREERKSIAMHCMEMNEVRDACSIM